MDRGDWICLQCGRYSYVGLYGQPESPVESPLPLPVNPRPVSSRIYSQHTGAADGAKAIAHSPAHDPALARALR